MRYFPRRRLLVDRKVQGTLIRRVAAYWIACVLAVESLNLAFHMAFGPAQPTYLDYFGTVDWRPAGIRLIASALILGFIVYDMLVITNRFAGPVYRMRRVLRKVAETGTIEPIRLRENDFWHLFADELNAALARLGSQQRQTSAAPQSQQRLADPIGSACQPLEPLRSQLNADDRACVPAKS